MGLMDFLKKRTDPEIGMEPSSFDADVLGQSNQNQFGMEMHNTPEFQPDHQNMSPSMSMSSMNGSNFGQPMQQAFPQANIQNDMQKDVQMISLKLDAIKSELDAINQRLRNLENIAEREQKPGKKWY